MTITPGIDLAAFAREHRVRFMRKDRSWPMRAIGWFLALFGYTRFMTSAWTTIGRTVYYPNDGPNAYLRFYREDWIVFRACRTIGIGNLSMPDDVVSYLSDNRSTIEHELYHVLQFERLWHLHSLLWLLFPVPFGLAWYRWWSERAGYLHQIKHYQAKAEVVTSDWSEMSHVEQAQLRDVLDKSQQQEEPPVFVTLQPGLPPHISLHVEVAIDKLWRIYGWCWPRSWMRRWFKKELANG
jgi:hypothetical protein